MDKPEFPALTGMLSDFVATERMRGKSDYTNNGIAARHELAALVAERDELLAVVKKSAEYQSEFRRVEPINAAARYLDAKAKEKERAEK